MQITARLEAQVRRAAGRSSVPLDVPDSATVADVVTTLARQSDEALQRLLIDDSGAPRPTVLVFVDDEHIPLASERRVAPMAVVTITSPISGG
jgi:molybdopterin converting factor small subunit